MDTPKPKPPVKKLSETVKSEKPKFVRPEHLTHRPFQDSEVLRKIQNQTKKGQR